VRLLVTGGAGFIGSAFVRRRLEATTDDIMVLDKLTYAGDRANLAESEERPDAPDRYRFIEGDIADRPLVDSLVREVDAVVNFAAESHVDRSILEPSAFLVTGVLGVHALLDAVVQANAARGEASIRFLQVSTDEVYGSVPEGLSVEDDPLRPNSPYSAAKASGELLVRAFRETHGLDTVITRGANTYGPQQNPEKLIPLFITNALQDLPLPMYGDGMQLRDWLYVDDHADAVGVVLDQGEPGAIYNVPGEGVERPNREVTRAILDALGKPWSLVREVPDRPGHDRRYAMDGTRLRALGWAPRVPFAEGIARTVRWYAEHEARWRAARDGAFEDYYRRQYAWRLERSAAS
jgi:dTDP-glucose 4,6-dehydratase